MIAADGIIKLAATSPILDYTAITGQIACSELQKAGHFAAMSALVAPRWWRWFVPAHRVREALDAVIDREQRLIAWISPALHPPIPDPMRPIMTETEAAEWLRSIGLPPLSFIGLHDGGADD